jgi:hypothetical protein
MAFEEANRIEGWDYDEIGVFSFTSKLNIIQPTPGKVWCSKTCAMLLTAAHPQFGEELLRVGFTVENHNEFNIDPQDLMMMANGYFLERRINDTLPGM